MKKYLAMLCATMLCVCCLGLAACGGSASSSAAASGSSASASASASSSSAAVSYAGDWKFAGMEANMGSGAVTMVGDLDAIASAFGGGSSSMTFGLTLKEDGTGSFVSGDQSYAVTWSDNGKGITLTDASGSASASSASASASSAAASGSSAGFGGLGTTLDLTYDDGVLSFSLNQDGQTGTIFFTKDGKLPGATEISAANAKPITSEADLVGAWKLSGMNMMGLSIYGDADALSAMAGGSADMSVTFEAGGKGKMSGSDFTYTVGSDGTTMESGGAKLPIQSLDGQLMIDMSELVGMPAIMVFNK